MRTFLLATILPILPFIATAQTLQKGCVRTPERYVDKQIVKSVYISGVKIEVEGRTNPAISGAEGRFDFPVEGSTYRIKSVSGGQYSLLDRQVMGKEYAYSATNDLVLLMTNAEDDLEFQLKATKRERANFQRETERLRKENEQLKAEGKINEEQYAQRIKELNERIDKENQLIKDFVEEYSKWDFKDIDDYNRQFRMLRIDGDFKGMDSLQRTRGDILGDTRRLIDQGATIADEKAKAEQRLREIAQADSLRRKHLLAKAGECYNSYLMYRDRAKNDSAAIYIELRAAIDTTNIDWQLETGRFISEYISDFDKAINYYQLALRNAIAIYGELNHNTILCYNNLGKTYYVQGKYDLAAEYFNKAEAISVKIHGEDHPETAVIYNNIGGIYRVRGQYDKALEIFNKALTIKLEHYGENDPKVAISYNDIGTIYDVLKDYNKAIEYQTKALDILLSADKKDKMRIATYYNNLGHLNTKVKQYSVALDYSQKALKLNIEQFGEMHPSVATCYNTIGSIYDDLKLLDKALEYYTKSVEIRKSIFGEEHPSLSVPYNNIANTYHLQGDLAKSLEYLKKSLALQQKAYGKDYTLNSTLYGNIGVTYFKMKKYDEALTYFKEAINILSKTSFGENHPEIAIINQLIARIYYLQQDWENFNKYFEPLVILAVVDDDSSPAAQQGLNGKYFLLEFEHWNIASGRFDANIINEFKGKPKTIVLMKDGVISEHHFENNIGTSHPFEYIGKEAKARIVEAYNKWKAENRK